MPILNVALGSFAALWVFAYLFWVRKKEARYLVVLTALGLGWGGFELFKNNLYPYYLAWQFESQMKKQPLFVLIASKHPIEYAQFLNSVKQILKENNKINLVPTYSAQLVNHIFNQHLSKTPNENIILYLKATIDLYRHLNALDPQTVVFLEKGNQTELNNLQFLFEDKQFQILLSRVLDTKRYAIEAGMLSPVSSNNEKEAQSLLKEVFNSLINQFGKEEVNLAFSSDLHPFDKKEAEVIIQFYTEILKAGQENAGTMMRYMAVKKSKFNHT